MGAFMTPDANYARVDVVCEDATDSPQLTIITGTPGRQLRVPPIPPCFLPVAYVVVPACGYGGPKFYTERDPTWISA